LYEIPKSTLADKVKGFHNKEVGRPVAISAEEEKLLVERILLASEWIGLNKKDLSIVESFMVVVIFYIFCKYRLNYPPAAHPVAQLALGNYHGMSYKTFKDYIANSFQCFF